MQTNETKTEPKFPVFKERFASLRPDDMTQAQFAEFLGLSRPTLAFYENGDRLPDVLVLKKICEKTKVSANWLLGLSEVKTISDNMESTCSTIGLSEKAVKALAHYSKRAQSADPMHQYILDLLASSGMIGFLLHIFYETVRPVADAYNLEKDINYWRYEQSRDFYSWMFSKETTKWFADACDTHIEEFVRYFREELRNTHRTNDDEKEAWDLIQSEYRALDEKMEQHIKKYANQGSFIDIDTRGEDNGQHSED